MKITGLRAAVSVLVVGSLAACDVPPPAAPSAQSAEPAKSAPAPSTKAGGSTAARKLAAVEEAEDARRIYYQDT